MRALVLALVVLAVQSGCSSKTHDHPPTPGQGGAGGSGGGGGGQGGSTGGAGGGAACTLATDCPTPESECELPTCHQGQCGVVPKAAGVPLATQVTGDCTSRQCDGSGLVVAVVDDGDLPIDANECTLDVCTHGVPSNPPKASGQACGAGGLLTCDGMGHCVGCTSPSSCGADQECRHPTCTQGICGVHDVPQGTALAVQTPGDCKKRQCNGAGGQETVDDDTDVFVDGKSCTTDACSAGTPINTPVAPGTPCSESSGKLCDVTGSCVECLLASDCPGADTECRTRTCSAGTCGVSFAPSGTAIASQTAGDCMKQVCDGAGVVVASNDDSDVPSDGNPCTTDSCSSGVPHFDPVDLGTGCGMGMVCNATGQCQECNQATDCGVDTECRHPTCLAGTCGVSFVSAGTVVSAQSAGDCRRNVCDGNGNITMVIDDADVPADDGHQCTADTCNGGNPSHPALPTNTPCAQSSGSFCDGLGSCVECNAPTQCTGNDTECHTRTCVAHACGVAYAAAGHVTSAQAQGDCKLNECDGIGGIVAVNDDTDLPVDDGLQCTSEACTAGVPSHPPRAVDFVCNQAGGSFCDGLGDCIQCNHPSQCSSLVCDVGAHTCTAPSCTDGLQNGSETGVDCGGLCPGCGSAANYRFAVIGDYGIDGPPLASVSDMVHGWNPDAVITVGDNVYSNASEPYDPIDGKFFHDFMSPYTGAYGAPSPSGNRFWPILGNHDYDILPLYLAYFTLPNNERYYDVALAPDQAVHLFALSGDPREPDGIAATSAQATWLQGRLAATTACFKLVTVHEPPYASTIASSSGDDPALQWPYQSWGADIVMSGDTHGYERLSVGGFPYIVDGVGGGALFGDWTNISPHSVYRFPTTPQRYGAVLLSVAIANGVGTLTEAFYGVGDTTPEDTLTITKSCN